VLYPSSRLTRGHQYLQGTVRVAEQAAANNCTALVFAQLLTPPDAICMLHVSR
jgi:hypothetical protein